MEHKRFIIERFDHYYDSINNKANVLLAVSIFIIGGLFACLSGLSTYLKETYWAVCLLIGMLGLTVGSLIATLIALIPYTSKKGDSLIYFGNIRNLTRLEFIKNFEKQDEAGINVDLLGQIYELAGGLQKKFYYLRIASMFLLIEAFFLIPLILIVINNLK